MAHHAPLPSASDGETVDIGSTLDHGDFTPLQRLIVLFVALAIVVDGIDNQIMAYALPNIMAAWNVEWQAFTAAIMASPFGMILGSLLSGYLADRIGRRALVLVTLALCGITTCLLGVASTPEEMIIWRFLTGCAIGGALPVCTTLAAEFAPLRYRTMIVTVSIVCVPLGGMLAGFIFSPILENFGWQTSFVVAGLLPLCLLALLWFTLPESPRFLSRQPERWGDLRALLQRLHRPVAPTCRFTDRIEQQADTAQKTSFFGLFRHGLALDTVTLSLSFFFCMIAIYAAFYWMPTMLVMGGMAMSEARFGLTLYNMGGVAGSLLCGLAISFFGSRSVLGLCALLGGLSVFALLGFTVTDNIALMLALMALHGLFVNGVQSTLYALPAHLYPTPIRATGTATAAACGRCGAIVASGAGYYIVTLESYFIIIGVVMVCVLAALLALRHHVPAIGMKRKECREAIFE